MTSTPFNIGLSDTARPTSRVLCPPGGGHTDIFGADPEPHRYGRRQIPTGTQSALSESSKPTNITLNDASNGSSQPNSEKPEQANKAVEEKPQAETEKTADVPAPVQVQEPPKVEVPKRVRVPPGGFSSGLW